MLSSSNARRKAVLALSLVSVVTVATFVAATPAGAAVTPQSPQSVLATPGNGTGVVTWKSPGSNGGYSITSFVATAEPGSKSCKTTGGTHRCVIAGLANGKSYRFAVKAGNEKGYGPAATTSAIVIGAPTRAVGVSGVPENSKVKVTWIAPANNGSAITKYRVVSTPGSKVCTSTGAATCTVTGLTNGLDYQFSVTATNARGSGPASILDGSNVITPAALFPLTGVGSVVSDSQGDCSLLTSGEVECWGDDSGLELGHPLAHPSSSTYDSIPALVSGVGGVGTLIGVESVVSDGIDGDFCALLTSGGVDCWGGDYVANQTSVPVSVVSVGGAGTLTGVSSLYAISSGFCAVLTSSGVDCWGFGYDGELGNGTTDKNDPLFESTPVAVEGIGGSGTLTGVESVADDGDDGPCAVLTSGGVDCWGGVDHPDGSTSIYSPPVAVEGIGGSGLLTGVEAVVNDSGGGSFCALLTSGGVDCWGDGIYGELGNGVSYDNTSSYGGTPVAVINPDGIGTLTGVASVAPNINGFCAVLTTGGVDCWGSGGSGQLGNGKLYLTGNEASDTPVVVKGVGGSGALSGVVSVSGGDNDAPCALLSSGGVDCWGASVGSTSPASTTPVIVKGVGAKGNLAAVASVVQDASEGYGLGGDCAVLTTGGVDCWGDGTVGELGNGIAYAQNADGGPTATVPQGSATPVVVQNSA